MNEQCTASIVVEKYFRPDYFDTTASKKGLLVRRLGFIRPGTYLWVERNEFELCDDYTTLITVAFEETKTKLVSKQSELDGIALCQASKASVSTNRASVDQFMKILVVV